MLIFFSILSINTNYFLKVLQICQKFFLNIKGLLGPPEALLSLQPLLSFQTDQHLILYHFLPRNSRHFCRGQCGLLVTVSVCPSHFAFFAFLGILRVGKFVFEHAPAQIMTAPAQIITAPAQIITAPAQIIIARAHRPRQVRSSRVYGLVFILSMILV